MTSRSVIWPRPIRTKLRFFRSPHFTLDETFEFIAQFILETEQLLSNSVVSRCYTEGHGEFKGGKRLPV